MKDCNLLCGRRGDVGSWVREAAMASLRDCLLLLPDLDPQAPQNDEMAGAVVAALAKQAVERIARLREVSSPHPVNCNARMYAGRGQFPHILSTEMQACMLGKGVSIINNLLAVLAPHPWQSRCNVSGGKILPPL
jgi:hypothetical protein